MPLPIILAIAVAIAIMLTFLGFQVGGNRAIATTTKAARARVEEMAAAQRRFKNNLIMLIGWSIVAMGFVEVIYLQASK